MKVRGKWKRIWGVCHKKHIFVAGQLQNKTAVKKTVGKAAFSGLYTAVSWGFPLSDLCSKYAIGRAQLHWFLFSFTCFVSVVSCVKDRKSRAQSVQVGRLVPKCNQGILGCKNTHSTQCPASGLDQSWFSVERSECRQAGDYMARARSGIDNPLFFFLFIDKPLL